VTSWGLDLLLLLTNAVYGTAYVAQREAVNTVPPGLLGFMRLAIASVQPVVGVARGHLAPRRTRHHLHARGRVARVRGSRHHDNQSRL